MSTWYDYVQSKELLPEWPYPIRYGQVREVNSDVLVIGGGVAGCQAAINAARRGARVAVAERGHAKRSGAGGAGVDHWHGACTNPCSRVTPEMYTRACYDSAHGYTSGLVRYIYTSEGWDTLLDCEKMGVRIRDVDDEFKGADFRDDETKLMFAYDYENRHIIRVWGYNIKPCLYAEMKNLDVDIHNRIMVTSLLTDGGKQGARVVGATGVNTRTGEFYVFHARTTVIATGGAGRLWFFGPELTASSSMGDMNAAGAGYAIGWNAGAEFACMEQTGANRLSGFGYTPYSMGGTSNTYHGTPIVDNNGKEVPWVDISGNELKKTGERFLPGKGQQFQLGIGIGLYYYLREFMLNDLTRDLPERIRQGEFKLPLYMDLSRLPESERRAIFGMMVGNEGKTRIPIYDTYTRAGFDPDKDMLQAPVMPPEGYQISNFWSGMSPPQIRGGGGGGLLLDWDLRTNLEGLYAAAGGTIYGGGCHGESHTTGRYAGRHAADYARTAPQPAANKKQVEAEKARVYAPLKQSRDGIGWKEINYAIARIMQDYCGRYKNETTLNLGLRLFKELRETELASAYASNPHELGRLLECQSLITCGEIIMHSSLARKASSLYMDFYRLDYPEMDPPEWQKLLPVKQVDGRVKVRELACDYHLKPPYAPSYEENYRQHCGL
ncbi:MAG TPA: FAD-dependent oxidoreductase [Dehalococcoidales bacterium]|nr:FAD-dependent oxidoreductase [Dehalococcoidales bacterium]